MFPGGVVLALPVSGKGPFGSDEIRYSCIGIENFVGYGIETLGCLFSSGRPGGQQTRSAVSNDGSIDARKGGVLELTGNGGGSPVTGLGEKFNLGSGRIL